MASIKRGLLVAISILAIGLMAACGGNDEGSGEVAATVNGEEIYQEELDQNVSQLLNMYGMSRDDEQAEEILQQIEPSVLDQMITEAILLQEAEKNDIEAPEEEVEAQLDQVKASIPEDTTFEEALAAQNYTQESLRQEIEDTLRLNTLLELNHIDKSEIEISDEEIQEYYDQLSEQYGDQLGELEEEEEKIKLSLQQEKYLKDLKDKADIEIL